MDYAAYHLRKAKIIELKRDPDIPYMLIIGVEFNHWSSFSGFMHAIMFQTLIGTIEPFPSVLPVRQDPVDVSNPHRYYRTWSRR